MTPHAKIFGSAPPSASCRGATLIEVLIAVVVLAIGLLGYAALQSTSLKAGQSAQLRSQATWLAYDIADRLRACKEDGGNGEMDTDCRDAEIADWEALVAAVLPDGSGEVDMPVTATRTLREFGSDREVSFIRLDVTIEWDDGRGQIRGEDGEAVSSDEQSWSFSTEI